MKLYRAEGTKTWVTYFACEDGLTKSRTVMHAANALEDDCEGADAAEVAVSHLMEVDLSSEEGAKRWLARMEEDGWSNAEPFVSGTVADGWDEDRSCGSIVQDYLDMLHAAKRAEEQAKRDAELDARQIELPSLDDHV